MVARLRRLWAQLVRWWVQPVPHPDQIGKAGRTDYRPIPLELAFFLHADGTVYHRSRTGDGDRRIEDFMTRSMVHAEYRMIVEQARRKARWLAVRRLLVGR